MLEQSYRFINDFINLSLCSRVGFNISMTFVEYRTYPFFGFGKRYGATFLRVYNVLLGSFFNVNQLPYASAYI